MDTFIELQLKTGAIIAISVLIYVTILARDSFFKRNRVWLLATIFVPWIMPLLAMPLWLKNLLFQVPVQAAGVPLIIHDLPMAVTPEVVETSFNWTVLFAVCYALVSLFLVIRLLYGYAFINRLKNKGKLSTYKNYKVILLKDEGINPFSFFRTIFMPQHLEREDDGKMILEHERTHCAQLHSIDISLSEFLLIIQWWNPFVWWLRRLIAQNHEYCVDNAMVQLATEPQEYQYSLLNIIQGRTRMQLVNNFNQSLTKKRLVMMNKQNTNRLIGWGKSLIVAPLIILAVLAFTNPEKTTSNTNVSIEISNNEDLRKHVAKTIKYPLEAQQNGIEGIVTANFKISKKGTVSGVKIGSNSKAVKLDKVVVVAYSTNEVNNGNSKGSKTELEELLNKEVVRVIEALPTITDKGLVGKTLQIDMEFILQNKSPQKKESLSGKWEGKSTNLANSKGEEFSLMASDGHILMNGPKGNQPIFVIDNKEVSWSEVAALDLNKVRAIGKSPAGNKVKVINAVPENGAFIIHTTDFVIPKSSARKAEKAMEKSLYYVDGKKVSKEEMEKLDPAALASVNVLKDKAAIDKYGKAAKFGVVEITTKNMDANGEEVSNSAVIIDDKSDKKVEEVVVVGYGTMRKSDASVGDLLVREGSKAEGVRIKGSTSENKPYILLDGEEYEGSMDDLDSDNIQSISVIKDQSAKALYGDKAEHGVIIITSKK
ncbi:M56 family metallopeptidase [Carboxylicivirga sp. M1479]|uniref:M56 family metallopeptidase n=1 Tax=Carboxylicivirga sp. M1479 TaxID=2594476 RepID=UPI0011780E4D|nr:M56 family metallopeptidase [Carboxylicivirga sp. M1479]TRX71744.1 hypothetical protein FNN09_03755 [Carboxylicivirga sp. M1479]